MASALSSHHSKNENEQLVSVIHIIFRFAQKLANRVIKLRKNDWGKLEKLALLLKDVSDEERFEIFDAMTEVIFPEEGIGSFIDVKKVTSREAQARSIAYRKKVGQEVRKHRKGLRMTQDDLAGKAGIPQSHVSRIEHGKHTPSAKTIQRLARALKTRPSQLDPGFSDDVNPEILESES